jgi:hypothetical protein
MTRLRTIRRVLPAIAVAAMMVAPPRARAESVGAFPNLEPWPVTLALGGAPRALGDGVDAVLENPASMLRGTGRALAFSHASLFTGGLVHHQSAAMMLPFFEESTSWHEGRVKPGKGAVYAALGLGVTNLSGELPGDDTYGETQISLCYAKRLARGIHSGVRVRFLQARSTVDGTDGTGTSIDLGMEGDWKGWRVGGVARALYSRVNWDRSIDGPLPSGFDLAVQRPVLDGLQATAGGMLLASGKPSRFSLGMAWLVPRTPLTLMAGPAWRQDVVESRAEIAAGMSLRVGPVRADYGMRTGPDALGEIHRFGLELDLP